MGLKNWHSQFAVRGSWWRARASGGSNLERSWRQGGSSRFQSGIHEVVIRAPLVAIGWFSSLNNLLRASEVSQWIRG